MQRIEGIRWKPRLLTLAIALVVAIGVNWAILELFGQKSADRAEHSLIGILLLMVFVSHFVRRQESRLGAVTFFLLALIPCYLGTVFPDLDITFFGIGAHRNPLFHSSLSFLILGVWSHGGTSCCRRWYWDMAWGWPAISCGM